MARQPRSNTNTQPLAAPVSLRNVPLRTWKDFKKLAAIHEMTLVEYLTHIVEREMSRVQISREQ